MSGACPPHEIARPKPVIMHAKVGAAPRHALRTTVHSRNEDDAQVVVGPSGRDATFVGNSAPHTYNNARKSGTKAHVHGWRAGNDEQAETKTPT